MKICLTEEEVQSIVLASIQQIFPTANSVTFNHYGVNYATVEHVEPQAVEPVELKAA